MSEQQGYDPYAASASAATHAAPPPVPQVPYSQAAQAAGEQLSAQAATSASGDAGETIEQIRQQVTRDVLLPMEQQFQTLMDQMQAQSAQYGAQIKQLQAQLAGTHAQFGPPAVQKYATAVQERLQTAASTAGLPADHWKDAHTHASALVSAAAHAVETGDAKPIEGVIAKLETWVTKTHPRLSRVNIEHFPALLGDLEELGLAAEKMVAAVA